MYRMVRAGTDSVNSCMFFYVMVVVKSIDSWDILGKKGWFMP